MIKRDLYLQRLIDRMNNGSIKVITGIRRCGKSVLLFDIFGEYLLQQGIEIKIHFQFLIHPSHYTTRRG